jgi:hypothetical protein
MDLHNEWVACLISTVNPVLKGFAEKTLSKTFVPTYSALNKSPNPNVPFVELYCRTLLGAAPFATQNRDLAALLVQATNSVFVDKYIEWECGNQLLVEMALVSLTFMRWPILWDMLPVQTQKAVIDIVGKANSYLPCKNNWILFKCTVEIFLFERGIGTLRSVISMLNEFEKWYVGDGWYMDGPVFHMDYYNSYVILPFLYDIFTCIPSRHSVLKAPMGKILERLQRQCEFQERLISPDGTYPLFGRSAVYRTGVFHALAYTAARKKLPASLSYAQVREALTAVMRKTFTRDIYDTQGFLRLGFGCEDLSLADGYSNNGSTYYCLLMFAPLALPPTDEFWTDDAVAWTQQKAWGGQIVPRDKSIN